MIRKPSDFSHKVKADTSFFSQQKKATPNSQKNKKTKARCKYEAKKMWQVMECKKRIYLILRFDE